MPKYILKHSRFMKGQWVNGIFVVHPNEAATEPMYVTATADFPTTIDVPMGHKVDDGMIPTDQETLDEKLVWRKKHAALKTASDANPYKGPAPTAPKPDEIYTETKDKLHFVEKVGHIMSSVLAHGKTSETKAQESSAKGKKSRISDDEPI